MYKIKLPEGQVSNAPRKRSAKSGKKSGTISSSIPGKVVTIEVELGSKVEEGQVCMILEAMKMQNEINAPISGIVSEINCSPGVSVDANIPLIVIKAEDDEE
ncbi:MAG: 2-oxoglutarate carboxylase large subunit [Methanobacteriota archaeon]|nr:MAG: 2-oxoglutarate carboxylase large subunit [Euryarchaeota archaeon]